MEKTAVLLNGLELTLTSPELKSKETLKINEPYPNTEFSQFIFSQLGLMHLVASHFPQIIKTNFSVSRPIRRLIGKMYASEKYRAPEFKAPKTSVVYEFPKTYPNRVAIAYSGGKDSMWNLWRAEVRDGMKNTLVAHIRGLNRANAADELQYTLRQQKHIGFENFKIIHLTNGSALKGYKVMLSRDMFLAAIIIPLALEFGASKIYIEGFSETGSAEPFTGREENMKYFNSVLKTLRIPVRVAWKNSKEMDVVKDLVQNRPEWLKHVCNCFSNPLFKRGLRKTWAAKAPSFPLYDSQCGFCAKCRITNLGRLLYGNEFKQTSVKDIAYFLEKTVRWIKDNTKNGENGKKDMIEGSFMRDFKKALKKYNFEHLSVAK